MTRNQILEAKKEKSEKQQHPKTKSCMDDETIEWTGRRAAYTMGIYHRENGKRMQRYWVAAWQSDYEDGYNGVHCPQWGDFKKFVKLTSNH